MTPNEKAYSDASRRFCALGSTVDTPSASGSLLSAPSKRRWAFLWEFALGVLAGAVILTLGVLAMFAL